MRRVRHSANEISKFEKFIYTMANILRGVMYLLFLILSIVFMYGATAYLYHQNIGLCLTSCLVSSVCFLMHKSL